MIKETLNYTDYEVTKQERSKIDSSSTTKVTVFLGFHCPKCKRFHRQELNQGQTYDCVECGLSMTRYGKLLECCLE